jgi:hypothetical protein
MIVDYAIYVDGLRTAEPTSLEETYEAHRQRGRVAWIDLYKPKTSLRPRRSGSTPAKTPKSKMVPTSTMMPNGINSSGSVGMLG